MRTTKVSLPFLPKLTLLFCLVLSSVSAFANPATPPKKPAKKPAATKTAKKVAAAPKKAVKAAPKRLTLSDATLRADVRASIERDNTAGEDPEVRRAIINALGNTPGTVVVMNPKTGQVYSVVNQDWALRRGFTPCSTIKLVTGLAGLSEGVIDPLRTVAVADREESINLGQALAVSNNQYFQQVGGQVGFAAMLNYARDLGLGQKTGTNLGAEISGIIPGKIPPYGVTRMSSHGDGFMVTPIQLASLVSAIANGGTFVKPLIARTSEEQTYFHTQVRHQLDLVTNWALREMLPGMSGAVKYGTAKRAYDATNSIAGKTGSCIGQGSWIGLFTSYAPVSDPQLAVVVVTRGTYGHGKFAAAIAGQVHRALKGRFTAPNNDWASVRDITPLRPRTVRYRPDANSDEEGDAMEADDNDDEMTPANPVPANPLPAPRRELGNGGARARRAGGQ